MIQEKEIVCRNAHWISIEGEEFDTIVYVKCIFYNRDYTRPHYACGAYGACIGRGTDNPEDSFMMHIMNSTLKPGELKVSSDDIKIETEKFKQELEKYHDAYIVEN